jgi:hypothetical protein
MSSTKPINIIFGNNKDNNDFIQCIFELTLHLKDNTVKNFKEISYAKYCNIFTYMNLIPFKLIKKYTLNIILIKLHKNTISIENNFILEDDTHIFKNEDVYIEFTQNNEGMTNCCCYLTSFDNTRLFITPPNY